MSMNYSRVFLIVIDSVGVGEMPDAEEFGDKGANTIGNLARATGGIDLPTLESFGYGNLTEIKGVRPVAHPRANTTKMAELSNGKDTMTGHWEIMGIKTTEPFQTFTETGFPDDLIEEIEAQTGRDVIGNKAASGTEIIKELGEKHRETGAIIVYTSADSVLQIAAHNDVVPLEELYDICEKVREITKKPEWSVARIIARPFIGTAEDGYTRTSDRHDYAMDPSSTTVLDYLKQDGYDVISVGKIRDIFNGSGITDHHDITSNHHGMETVMSLTEQSFKGLCFTNLVDFDAKYGHRRNPEGYKEAMEEFDRDLTSLIEKLNDDDMLIVTADHGNDPTHHGTDHTREYVPLFIYNHRLKGRFLPESDTFADIGATVADIFDVDQTPYGKSLLDMLT